MIESTTSSVPFEVPEVSGHFPIIYMTHTQRTSHTDGDQTTKESVISLHSSTPTSHKGRTIGCMDYPHSPSRTFLLLLAAFYDQSTRPALSKTIDHAILYNICQFRDIDDRTTARRSSCCTGAPRSCTAGASRSRDRSGGTRRPAGRCWASLTSPIARRPARRYVADKLHVGRRTKKCCRRQDAHAHTRGDAADRHVKKPRGAPARKSRKDGAYTV